MEAALIVVGLVALALGALAAWAVMGRTRLGAEVAGLRATCEGLERARAEAEAAVQRLSAREREMSEGLAAVGAEKATLREQLDAAVKAHHADRNHLYEKFQTEQGALEERWRAEVEKQRGVSAEQLASVVREREEIKAILEKTEQRFRDVFGSLAGEALKKNNEQFLTLAEQKLETKRAAVDELVKPIAETLKKTDQKLSEMEQGRASAFATLSEQIRGVNESGRALREETGRLVQALKRPEVRGRWGEIQLERVVEIAGMKNYCDLAPQDTTRDADGRALRPDMTINLPNGRVLAVDAKTNINAYMEAVEARTPEEAEACLERFAENVAGQVVSLGAKNYWQQFEASPEFVVMFIPGEQFVDAALQRRPDLIEKAAGSKVILATPSTLIGLLKAVAVGWRERRIDEQARELYELGRQLHERAATVANHLQELGESLTTVVKRYNAAVGSYESRLTPTLRKFEEAGARSAKEIPELPEVSVRPRERGETPRLLPE